MRGVMGWIRQVAIVGILVATAAPGTAAIHDEPDPIGNIVQVRLTNTDSKDVSGSITVYVNTTSSGAVLWSSKGFFVEGDGTTVVELEFPDEVTDIVDVSIVEDP